MIEINDKGLVQQGIKLEQKEEVTGENTFYQYYISRTLHQFKPMNTTDADMRATTHLYTLHWLLYIHIFTYQLIIDCVHEHERDVKNKKNKELDEREPFTFKDL